MKKSWRIVPGCLHATSWEWSVKDGSRDEIRLLWDLRNEPCTPLHNPTPEFLKSKPGVTAACTLSLRILGAGVASTMVDKTLCDKATKENSQQRLLLRKLR